MNNISLSPSFGYQYENKRPYVKNNFLNYWNPGFAWACTREAYEKMDGLFQYSIIGGGDSNLAFCILNSGVSSIVPECTNEYKKKLLEFNNKINTLKLGYVPGIIKHYFHGSKKNRKYIERWQILVNNKYSHDEHITINNDGLLIPTDKCPKLMLDQIMEYFKERNDDEMYN